jgi:hypothetical protein
MHAKIAWLGKRKVIAFMTSHNIGSNSRVDILGGGTVAFLTPA